MSVFEGHQTNWIESGENYVSTHITDYIAVDLRIIDVYIDLIECQYLNVINLTG